MTFLTPATPHVQAPTSPSAGALEPSRFGTSILRKQPPASAPPPPLGTCSCVCLSGPPGVLCQKKLGDCRKPEDAKGPHPHTGAVGHQQRPGQISFRPGSRKAWAGATWWVRPEGSLSTWPSTERGSGSRGARPAAGEEEAEKQWFLSDPARGHRTHVDRQEPHILGRTGTPKPMSDFSLMQVGQGGGGKLGSGEGWHARQRDPCGPKCGG